MKFFPQNAREWTIIILALAVGVVAGVVFG